jgi:hypothetical protein
MASANRVTRVGIWPIYSRLEKVLCGSMGMAYCRKAPDIYPWLVRKFIALVNMMAVAIVGSRRYRPRWHGLKVGLGGSRTEVAGIDE